MAEKSFTLTISSGGVDSVLNNFPLMVHLCSAAGIGGTDTGEIFTQLGANSGKFTIQDPYGVDLPIEIESWDSTNQEAYLWVNVPAVSAAADTVLTLKYNPDASDYSNVYDTASQGASAVWNSSYVAVWHMSEDGTGTRFDSTSASNNIIPQNYDNDEATTGKINGADVLDGANDFLSGGNPVDFQFERTDTFTFTAWTKHSNTSWRAFICKSEGGSPYEGYWWRQDGNGTNGLSLQIYGTGGINYISKHTNAAINDNTQKYIASTYDGSSTIAGIKHYINGIQDTDTSTAGAGISNSMATSQPLYVGRSSAGNYNASTLDELRISNQERSASYLKADYNSQNDSLVTYTQVYTLAAKTIIDFETEI